MFDAASGANTRSALSRLQKAAKETTRPAQRVSPFRRHVGQGRSLLIQAKRETSELGGRSAGEERSPAARPLFARFSAAHRFVVAVL